MELEDSQKYNSASQDKAELKKLKEKFAQTEIERKILKKIYRLFGVATVVFATLGYIGLQQIIKNYAEEQIQKSTIKTIDAELKEKSMVHQAKMKEYSVLMQKELSNHLEVFKESLKVQKDELFQDVQSSTDKRIGQYIQNTVDSKLEKSMSEIIEKKYTETINDRVDYSVKTELATVFLRSKEKLGRRSRNTAKTSNSSDSDSKQIINNNYAIVLASNKKIRKIKKVWGIVKGKNNDKKEELKLCSPTEVNGTYMIVSYPDESQKFKNVQYYKEKYYKDAWPIRLSKLNELHECTSE